MAWDGWWQLGLPFLASAVLAGGAFARRSLTALGACAAWLVGVTIWCGLGAGGFGVLCVFFLTSTLLGRVGKRRKAQVEEHYAKGHRRDQWQVLANGGVAALCGALLWGATASGALASNDVSVIHWVTLLKLAACASLASANADTWATELGVLSRRDPWHLTEWRRVPRGTSGAVSGLGLAVALLGAGTIGMSSACLVAEAGQRTTWMVILTLVGFGGAGLDSVFGATLQRQYRCARCHATVEVLQHCGEATQRHAPVWALLGNDGVNFFANLLAGVLALCLALI